MAWEGLSDSQICHELLDPARNGGRSVAALAEHFAQEPLVLWAWEPGVDHDGRPRQPPPLTHAELNRIVAQWIATGAQCPE